MGRPESEELLISLPINREIHVVGTGVTPLECEHYVFDRTQGTYCWRVGYREYWLDCGSLYVPMYKAGII